MSHNNNVAILAVIEISTLFEIFMNYLCIHPNENTEYHER